MLDAEEDCPESTNSINCTTMGFPQARAQDKVYFGKWSQGFGAGLGEGHGVDQMGEIGQEKDDTKVL